MDISVQELIERSERLERYCALLKQQNRELAKRNEELLQQNEELRRKIEEVYQRSQKLNLRIMQQDT